MRQVVDLDVIIELDAMKKVHTAAVSLSTTGDHEPQRCCSVIQRRQSWVVLS